ncbi:MAG: hypothetical protein OXG17_01860 [Chloroflexi bacterium]|nr:hypothetical protein [Chloroflexota bacterium]
MATARDSRQVSQQEIATETDLAGMLLFVEQPTVHPDPWLLNNIETHVGGATGVHGPQRQGDPPVVFAVQPSGIQDVRGLVRIPMPPPVSWHATGLFGTNQVSSSDSDIRIPQDPEVLHSWLYRRVALDAVIRHCQDRQEFRVAERIRDLAEVQAADVQIPMDHGSLLAAIRFVDQRRRDARARRLSLQPVVGIGYPAMWLTHRGEVQLLWETDDQRLSIIVTCRREGLVHLDMHDDDRDWSEELSLDEALAHSRAFLTKIT